MRGLKGDLSAVQEELDFASFFPPDRDRAWHCGARKTAGYAAVMAHRDGFWKLEHLSDAQLLESLGSVLRTQRGTLAELVAHLGEVEDRRLHLEAAHGSMFSYCVARLGMSEDEACRRIELARLARKFPALFTELAIGQISLSVALVLKPVLSASNQLELLSAARGKSIRQARELVAERFPKPDAPSTIRKLPDPRPGRPSPPAETCASVPLACLPLPLLATATVASPAKATHLPPASPTIPAVTAPSLAQACALTFPLGRAPAVAAPVLPPPEWNNERPQLQLAPTPFASSRKMASSRSRQAGIESSSPPMRR
jgi:hypothetical protein